MTAFLAKHPVAAYFVLTFTISWGGVLLVLGALGGMTGVKAQENPVFPLALLAMVAGPSLTGILLTGLIDGQRGLGEFRSRLLKWRVGAAWYAVALLAAPLLAMTVTSTLAFFSREFVPGILAADDKVAVVLLGLVVGTIAGFFEELGWTGFAIPRLKQHHSVLATGLIVGLLWSGWHVLVVVWGIGERAGAIPLPVFIIVDGLAGLPAFRVLMVWVYDRTGSLAVGMLMHVSLTASTLILTPQTTGIFLLVYGLTFAAAVWLVLAAISVTSSRPVSRRPIARATSASA